jgi:hypothetical protein
VSDFDVSLYEPIYPPWTADSIAVTGDSTIFTADGGPIAIPDERLDAAVNAYIVEVSLTEPAQSLWTADSITVTGDSTFYTADGGPLRTPDEIVDAEVIAAEVPAGGWDYRPRRLAVIGVGYGVLPALAGEGHGTVYIGGAGVITLPGLGGEGRGEVDDDDEILMLLLLAA